MEGKSMQMRTIVFLTILFVGTAVLGQGSKLEFESFPETSLRSNFGWKSIEAGLPQNLRKADLIIGIRDADDFVFLWSTTFGDERSRSIAVGLCRPAAGNF